jgi:lipopolysaccharide export system permease protein
MLNKVQTYIFKQILVSTIFSVSAVTLVIWLSQSLRLIELVIGHGSSVGVFLHLMLLTLPTFLAIILPLGAMGGVIFVYHKLTTDSELVVMRAAGMSPLAIARPALVLSGLLAAFAYLLTLQVAPAANRDLIKLQYSVKNDYSVLLLREGVFNTVSDGLTVYAKQRRGENELAGIILQDARQPDHPITVLAERGLVKQGANGPEVVVFNGRRQEIDRATGRLAQLEFEHYTIDLNILHKNDDRWQEPRERTMRQLLNPQGDDRHPVTMGRFLAEYHQRLATPLFCIAYMMIALAVILSGEFNRRGMSRRIIAAVAFVVVLQSAVLGFVNLIGRVPSLIPVFYALAIIPTLISIWVLKGRFSLAKPTFKG